jgi:hypothetical protein
MDNVELLLKKIAIYEEALMFYKLTGHVGFSDEDQPQYYEYIKDYGTVAREAFEAAEKI